MLLCDEQNATNMVGLLVRPLVEWALGELVVGRLMWSQANGTRLIVMFDLSVENSSWPGMAGALEARDGAW